MFYWLMFSVNFVFSQFNYQEYIDTVPIFNKYDSLVFYNTRLDKYLKSSNYENAIEFEKKILGIYFELNDTTEIINHQIKLAKYYFKNNNYDKAINNLELISHKPAIVYYYLGLVYKKKLDFTNAIKYLTYARKSVLNKEREENLLINISIQLSYVYMRMNTIEQIRRGVFIVKYADSIANKTNVNRRKRGLLKFNIATLYNQFDYLNIPQAKKYYLEALTLAKLSKDSIQIAKIFTNLGVLFNTSNLSKSLSYLDNAMLYCKKTDTLRRNSIVENYGLTYALNNDLLTGIKYLKKSLKYNLEDDFCNLNINLLLKLDIIKLKIVRYTLLNIADSYLKLYEKSKDKLDLQESIQYYKFTEMIYDIIKDKNQGSSSKITFQNVKNRLYGNLIKAYYYADDVANAFYYMEKNKVHLLQEEIKKQNKKHALSISKELLAIEKNQQRVIINYKLFNDKRKDSLDKLILDSEIKLKRFQDSIYKGMDKVNFSNKAFSLQSLRNTLNDNELFIEFFIQEYKHNGIYNNENNGFLIIVDKQQQYFINIPNLSTLKEQLKQLITTYKKPLKTRKSIDTYNKLSYEVYDKLFPTDEIKKLLKNKKVIIATDSYLSYLPFEALITKKDNIHYLIEDCTISYEYSYSFSQNKKPLTKNHSKTLGIAPSIFKDSNLTTLDHSTIELTALDKFYSTKLFEREKAAKDTFINELPNYNIIHLATHANAQDSITPWIAFYDRKLYLPELQLLKNNASLVVLSGCNTTLGKQETGEGVMSLARGFFYGGAQSVISSLWSIDDVSTTYIMEDFYKNLSKGKTKSESLRNAKLSYLESHSLSEVSPHFWASFILLGNDDTIISASNTPYNVFIFVFLLLIIIILRYKMKK